MKKIIKIITPFVLIFFAGPMVYFWSIFTWESFTTFIRHMSQNIKPLGVIIELIFLIVSYVFGYLAIDSLFNKKYGIFFLCIIIFIMVIFVGGIVRPVFDMIRPIY